MIPLANGVGVGFAYASLYYSTQLSDSAGYGIIPSSTCPSLDLYFTTGITIMLLSLLYIILTIINFHGHRENSKRGIVIIVLSATLHYLFAAIPKIFSEISNGCIYVFSIMSALIVTLSFGIYRQSILSIGEFHDERLRQKRKPAESENLLL